MGPISFRCCIRAALPSRVELENHASEARRLIRRREQVAPLDRIERSLPRFVFSEPEIHRQGHGTAYGLRSRLASLRGSRPHQKSNAAWALSAGIEPARLRLEDAALSS